MKTEERIILVFVMLFLVSWIWNAVKFTSCDFESDFRCEVVHGIGLFVPMAAMVTVWFDTDE